MRRGQPLGLDELMIVNPGPPHSGGFVLGDDGTLYRVQGPGLRQEGGPHELGQLLLGDDGTVYHVQGFEPSGLAERVEGLAEDDGSELGRFFLGDDGAVYEIVR